MLEKLIEEKAETEIDISGLSEEVIDFIYILIYEIDELEADLKTVRGIARNQRKIANKQFLQIDQLKKDNRALRQFIEDHVDEEKQKLIFKN